ncbi:MAG: hypothetical protein ABH891_06305 [Candidatus Omnitrophota bacterium]
MNIKDKRSLWAFVVFAVLFLLGAMPAYAASPWMAKQNYGGKTWGKFCFGIKNSLLGWMTPWAEAKNPKYQAQWMGYSAGIGEGVVYTAGGLIQLATFFIPVDFPNMGYGLPIPDPERVKNPPKSYAPYSKK